MLMRSLAAASCALLCVLNFSTGVFENNEVYAISSRSTYQFLKARSEWKALQRESIQKTGKASSCPEPASCNCHCDCPETKFEKAPLPPPPCPIYPAFPTIAPTPRKAKKKVVKKKKVNPNPDCPAGEVARADGTCQVIDESVIKEIKAMVVHRHGLLNKIQAEYKTLTESNCKHCSPKKEKMRKKLLLTHESYRKALDMLLGALAMMPAEAKAAKKAAEVEDLGPEFIEAPPAAPADTEALKTRHPNCETWTASNSTFAPTKDDCGVLCRNQPTCIGFGQEASTGSCVWFDEKKDADAENSCSQLKNPQYLKKREVALNNDIFKKIETIHGLQELLETQLVDSNGASASAAAGFDDWAALSAGEADKELEKFVSVKGAYTGSLTDSKLVWFQLKDATDALVIDLQKEKLKSPPFGVTLRATTAAPVTVAEEKKPQPLAWSAFPNSLDSKWAERHPECPQGPPCFCDCQCRGVPPQNFVEPPPPPPAPCPPPPPTPPPTALSMPMGAPPALPLR